jgi:hypothetical protein
MKILKNVVLSLFMAVSVAGVSTAALASENSEKADIVIAKIKEAKDAITAEKPNKDVSSIVSEAKAKSKNISASDQMAVKVQRAAQHLSKAIGALKESDPKLATEHLNAGEEAFTKLKPEL